MAKRVFFASIGTGALVIGAASFVACSGTDATIGGDAPDAATGSDATTGPGADGSAASDTGVGSDTGVFHDAAPAIDGGLDSGQADTGVDSGAPDSGFDGGPLNGCTPGSYADHQNGGQDNRVVTFPSGPPGNFTYSIPCMRIKKGQSVQFNGDFKFHPLEAMGGDLPTPFVGVTNTGLTKQYDFPGEGTFGYHCQEHATMIGAIEVVK